MSKCSRYEKLIEKYFSGDIFSAERDDLEKHLSLCSECSHLYSDLSEIDSLLRSVPEKEVDPPPYVKTRVMARVAEEGGPKGRIFTFRPVYALSAALCLILLVGVYAYYSRPKVVRVVKFAEKETQKPADFYAPQFTDVNGNRVIREVKIFFYNPDARKVSITGDFNNWNFEGLPLRPTGKKGLWEVTLRLKQGVYSYNFIIDGKMIVPDPKSPTQAPDGFGGMNSVIFIKEGETS